MSAQAERSSLGPGETGRGDGSGEARLAGQAERDSGRAPLLLQALTRENMVLAWKRVKANAGSAGSDGLSVRQTAEHLAVRWPEVREQLLTGSYRPRPVRRVQIPKPEGGMRELGIPTVTDRLIQQAAAASLATVDRSGFLGAQLRLSARLRLKVNEAKSTVSSAFGRKFLGYSLWRSPSGEVKRAVARKAVVAFKQRIRRMTKRNAGRSMDEVAEQLRSYLLGWKAYFRHAQTPRVKRELDEWLRHRLRAVQLKQWRRGTTMYRELRAWGRPRSRQRASPARRGAGGVTAATS
jgi:hypothetical protein